MVILVRLAPGDWGLVVPLLNDLGRTSVFCSGACRARFQEAPARYGGA